MRWIAKAGARRLCGADLAPNILEVAREKPDREFIDAELRTADAEDSLPWPPSSFDVVTLKDETIADEERRKQIRTMSISFPSFSVTQQK